MDPPGTGKAHLAIALGVAAARRGQRVAFATAYQWVNHLGAAKRAGRLDEDLEREVRAHPHLMIVDREVDDAPPELEQPLPRVALVLLRPRPRLSVS